MEIKPPGESWIADTLADINRWFYLLDQYFANWLGVYTAFTLTLAALVGVAVVYYMLARPNIGRKLSITFAVAVGFAFIVQTLIAVKVPNMAEGYGLGYTATCQVFERDENGRLVYDPYQVMIDGELKVAMIARKTIYMVESTPPVVGTEKGQVKLGFLLTSVSAEGEFPTFCGIPFNQEAQELLENIELQGTPVNVDIIFEALLMEKDGYHAFSRIVSDRWRQDPDKMNDGVKFFLQHLATQLQLKDILPLSKKDLIRAMSDAGKAIPYSAPNNLRKWMVSMLENKLLQAGFSAEDAELVAEDWMLGIGRYNILIKKYISGEKDPGDVLPSDLVMFTLSRYGVGRTALLDMMDSVIRQLNTRYSGLYAAEVVRIIEELKLHERKPLIVLPGTPPYYLIDPPEGEGEEGDGEEGEGEEGIEGAYEDGISERITGERFGPRSSGDSGGAKSDADRT